MKANELRIGNFIYNERNEIFKVNWITEMIESQSNAIPITEEWLLKFGFASNPYVDRYEKREIHIECNKTKGETQLWIEGMPHIKHVHQLQNLYFALTGEELTYGGNK
jgi:hypothetical protein